MTHNHFITKLHKHKALILIVALVFAAGFIGETALIRARAEAQTISGWIICQPGDYINARRKPSTRSESLGRLEAGYPLQLTGKTKNGFVLSEVSLEESEAWVFAGYVVTSEPVWYGGTEMSITSNGRVACRKYIDGPRRCWVTDGSTVRVWWKTSTWCVTDKGFIRTEYITEE